MQVLAISGHQVTGLRQGVAQACDGGRGSHDGESVGDIGTLFHQLNGVAHLLLCIHNGCISVDGYQHGVVGDIGHVEVGVVSVDEDLLHPQETTPFDADHLPQAGKLHRAVRHGRLMIFQVDFCHLDRCAPQVVALFT